MIKGYVEESDLSPNAPYNVYVVCIKKEDVNLSFNGRSIPVVVIEQREWEEMRSLLRRVVEYDSHWPALYSLLEIPRKVLAILEGRK